MEKAFYIKTFGCQMNIRDSEIMAQSLYENGYVENNNIDDVELIIVNTCAIREKAEQKFFSMLGALKKQKERTPQLLICVAGCVAQQLGTKIIERMGHVDLVIGTQYIYDLPRLIQQCKENNTLVTLRDNYQIPHRIPSPSAANNQSNNCPVPHAGKFSRFVTIMQGCNNFCSYCVVPYTRGREISRNVNDIVEEVKSLSNNGVKEIILLGQNVNSYGMTNQVSDKQPAYRFSDLLTEVSRINGVKRLRFTTSHPKDLSDELIGCFGILENLCPHLHLPVQSGSDAVLRSMNRKYTVSDYVASVKKLKRVSPDIAISTDIIVGFPGETEKDFEQTMALLERLRFHSSFSFKYSDRPGTAAHGLPDKVPEAEKTRRLQRFQKRQDQITLEENQKLLGETLPLMIETVSGTNLTGRTALNHITHCVIAPSRQAIVPGAIVDAEIIYAGPHSLKASIVGDKK